MVAIAFFAILSLPCTEVTQSLAQPPPPQKRSISFRGVATIGGLMLGSAAATTLLSAHLPDKAQFLSHFVGQLSALGIYAIGAPLWEPLSSRFRQWAFRQSRGSHQSNPRDELERLWTSTQRHYSLNGQMSRNVLTQALILVTPLFELSKQQLDEKRVSEASRSLFQAYQLLAQLFEEVGTDNSMILNQARVYFQNISLDVRRETLEIAGQNHDPFFQSTLERWFDLSAL